MVAAVTRRRMLIYMRQNREKVHCGMIPAFRGFLQAPAPSSKCTTRHLRGEVH